MLDIFINCSKKGMNKIYEYINNKINLHYLRIVINIFCIMCAILK